MAAADDDVSIPQYDGTPEVDDEEYAVIHLHTKEEVYEATPDTCSVIMTIQNETYAPLQFQSQQNLMCTALSSLSRNHIENEKH